MKGWQILHSRHLGPSVRDAAGVWSSRTLNSPAMRGRTHRDQAATTGYAGYLEAATAYAGSKDSTKNANSASETLGQPLLGRSDAVQPPGELALVHLQLLTESAGAARAAHNVIHHNLRLALGGAAVLRVLDGFGWRISSAAFDRERLITGTG
jgi:hypothetical protein